MAQLHELLAVEGDLKGAKDKNREETLQIFTGQQNVFLGGIRTLEMFDEARQSEEQGGTERGEIVATVPEKLQELAQTFTRFWDAKLQKETANQEAKADIVIDGKPFIKAVPVTFLLAMEEELKQLRKVYHVIPTLQPGVAWEKDPQKGEGYWKIAHPVIKNKTEKTVQHKILVPATPEHPAQVREWTEDKPVGRYVAESWSGMLSPAEKAKILRKLDKMYHAIKKARQRANNQEVKPMTIGEEIFSFILND